MVEQLKERFAGTANVEVVLGDALELQPERVFGTQRYMVVANLPYNAGRRSCATFSKAACPTRLVVMLQKEVAESMLAPAGEMGLLAIGVQVYAADGSCSMSRRGPSSRRRRCADRDPAAGSGDTSGAAQEQLRVFEVVRAGFSAPRKQLRNTLAKGLGLRPSVERTVRAAGLDPAVRPQRLSIDDWLRVKRSLDAAAD
jgi:16S rRNA (adenine1518-N6/adenine1519-N6)-dimethyltransferase